MLIYSFICIDKMNMLENPVTREIWRAKLDKSKIKIQYIFINFTLFSQL